jgi:hypothetical protein
MKTVKPTAEQAKVLMGIVRWVDYNDETPALSYYKGGWWALAGVAVKGDGCPEGWTTSLQTIHAMEKKGWLRPVPGTGYRGHSGLGVYAGTENRVLTEAGLEMAGTLRYGQ